MRKVIFICCGAFLSLQGQNAQKMNLAKCVETALANNEHLRTAGYEIVYHKQVKRAATEIPKTGIVFTQGQFNSVYKYDNSFAVSQTIPFPAVFAANNSVEKAHVKGSEYKMAATRADLIYQVRSIYYQLIYHYSMQHLLQKEDSIYLDFAKLLQEKFNSGTANLLEKTTAETKVMEIRNQLLENEEDINSHEIHLQTLLNSDQQISIVYEDLTEKPLSINADSSNYASHPYLQYLHQQIIAGRKHKLLELYRALPDLHVGYFNLSIYGPADIGMGPYFQTTSNRMQGFTLGMNVPLWFHPLAAKVKAAEVKTKIAQSEYNYNKDVFIGEFKQAHALYLKYQNSVDFYRNNAMANSKVIIEQAKKSYDSKEISYIDYLNVVSNALGIESKYLYAINQNNLMVLKLDYLMAK